MLFIIIGIKLFIIVVAIVKQKKPIDRKESETGIKKVIGLPERRADIHAFAHLP